MHPEAPHPQLHGTFHRVRVRGGLRSKQKLVSSIFWLHRPSRRQSQRREWTGVRRTMAQPGARLVSPRCLCYVPSAHAFISDEHCMQRAGQHAADPHLTTPPRPALPSHTHITQAGVGYRRGGDRRQADAARTGAQAQAHGGELPAQSMGGARDAAGGRRRSACPPPCAVLPCAPRCGMIKLCN